MGMWGVEEDDTKGKARLPSTVYYIYIYRFVKWKIFFETSGVNRRCPKTY